MRPFRLDRCGPCVSITQIGNSTPVPRLTAASISTAVVSAIVFVKKRGDRHSIVSSRALQASFAHLPTCCDEQFIEHLIRRQNIAETLVDRREADIVVLLKSRGICVG